MGSKIGKPISPSMAPVTLQYWTLPLLALATAAPALATASPSTLVTAALSAAHGRQGDPAAARQPTSIPTSGTSARAAHGYAVGATGNAGVERTV